MIRESDWPAGHRLPSQRNLALELGFSRPTIREALASMEATGHVIIIAAKGVFLSNPQQLAPSQPEDSYSAKTVSLTGRESQMYQFRLAIEPAIAELVAQNATEAQRKDLAFTTGSMHKALESSDMDQFSRFDFIFHSQMIEAANNRFFTEAISPFLDLFFESQKLPFKTSAEGNETLKEHEEILRYITAKQPDKAHSAMKQHILGVASRAGSHI